MRLRDILICCICIVAAGGLFIAAGVRLDYINSQREQMHLITNEPLKNAPPWLAFPTVAMGAFRGLVVDILWIRADMLKEQGQFFDAKQLAEWITDLQPRFSSVWEFQAWNMAYNISVTIPASQPDQRWRWVKNGYELLRDKGIPLNPNSISLYRDLARIFQHKIGDIADDAHKYYKLQLVLAMEPLLGPANNEYFDALADAPDKWQEIVKNPDVAGLISALKTSDSVFANNDKFVDNYLSLRQNPNRFNPAAFTVIDRYRGTAALEKFDIFAKAYYLRNTWKLDPVLMRDLNKVYGPADFNDPNMHFPLDWRHPDSHAIYWAVKGLREIAKNEKSEVSLDETNTDRIVGHCLQSLFRYGKIFVWSSTSESAETVSPASSPGFEGGTPSTQPTKEIFLRPDLRMFYPYHQSLLAVLNKYKDTASEGSYQSLQDGHRNMLKNAVLLFYQAGHELQAQRIYNELRKRYPRDEFKVPLIQFARNRLREELKSIDIFTARERIIGLLMESYLRYALRDDDTAFSREKLAQEIWDYYQTQYPDEQRIDLPDFKLLRYMALMDFINDEEYPADLRNSLLGRIQIERPQLYKQLEQQEQQLMEE